MEFKFDLYERGCKEIPKNLTRRRMSITTFDGCVDIYQLPGCQGDKYRVNSSLESVDLSIVQKFMELNSIQACDFFGKNSNLFIYLLIFGGISVVLCIILVIVRFKKLPSKLSAV